MPYHAQHVGLPKLPTRVIDVEASDSPNVRLCEPNCLRERYIALSYCWGHSQPLVATLETLESLRAGIAMDILPQTFQDAIKVTRSLGVRYLWIDALCIIQDDPMDWKRESAQMASIYSDAYLTVAASRSSDSQEGFLQPRETPASSSPINIPVDEGPFAFFLYPAFSGDYNNPDPNQPLRKRAWALQERLLSPRYLSFETKQIFLVCSEILAVDDNLNNHSPESREIFFRGLAAVPQPPAHHMKILHPSKIELQQRETRSKKFERWSEIVEEYSRCQLTFRQDKLQALAGVAQEISVTTGCQYYAGLWKEDLLTGLLWS
ncbi:HET-domain-containing protein, partial [Saccharata proteae CBS 121410]